MFAVGGICDISRPFFFAFFNQTICVLVNYLYLCDMEKVLGLYKYVDGINDVPFPNEEHQVITSSFRYDVKRMGGAPMISCTIMHELCLDKLWDDNVYASFNGEKFFIKQTPSSSYDNTDSRYKHEVELVSERIVLDNVYFYDVVDSDASYDKPVSNSSRFTFFGDVREFAERLNQSLQYSKLGYSVVVDSGISSEAKQISFEDQFFSNVLQEIYNTYNIPYYFSQKVIHIGYTSNAITQTFKYGQDESLLSINKQNANYKIVNRITGVGSQDNIPYYYPNDYESKEEVEANGGTWINPQTNLMPPIYRESRGKERFYSALNNTYINPDSGSYYTFSNPYVDGKPKEHIINFEDIKPSIKGMTNAVGSRIDMFMDFAYDLDDNDETDEEGNYLHPYFFAKLKRFDGVNGFNLFDHAIEEEEMVISMTSGSCAACEWVIGVDEETQKNIVQVDEQGNLLRDEDGNVKFGSAQDRQNDTQNYEVWIALRKDIETFWVILPNATNNYKPSTSDTFVILHIDLPKSYILAAEERLKDSLIKYMSMNNDEKFNFSISFSRIFFAENPSILEQLDENARLQIEYDGERYELYVSSYSYSMTSDKPLPEVRVELSDTLTINQNALQIAINEVKQDILASFGGGDFLKQGLKYFLRKDVDDRSRGKISSDKGFEAGKFRQGILGSGASIYVGKDNNTYIEGDFLTIRKKAFFTNITVQELKHVGGEIVLSPAAMVCCKVEELTTCYRCYFYAEDSDGLKIYNEFEVGDQARCQTFNIDIQANGSFGSRYFWRLVVGMNLNDETIEIDERQCHYIDLSKADCDSGSDIPEAGDNIVQLGNRNDTLRQNAIVLSAYGVDAPSYKQYNGIKTYSLEDAELVTQFSPNGNYIKGKFVSESGADIEDELGEVKVNWDKVLSQTDKEFTMWFFDYSPSADMLPESDWTTDDLKALHEEDLFYNTNVDHEDGGKAWRYVYDEELGKYVWEIVTDAETIKALEKASKANKRLDNIVSDGILSAAEKKEVLKEWEAITKSYEWNVYSSEKIGIEETSEEVVAYKDSYNALGTYMNDGISWSYGDGLPFILYRKDEDTPIVAEEYREVWTSYYTEETKLRNLLSEKAKGKADEVQEEIDNIVSDNILSSLEKKEVLKEWEAIVVSYTKNVENASNNKVNHDDYTTAYYALGTYLNGGNDWDGTSTPSWLIDTSTNQEIDAEVYRTKWINYYSEEVDLLASISDAIKTVADSKIRNFVSQPVPPYDEGDRWSNATYGDLFDDDDLVCVTPKADGESFSIEDWRPVAYGKTSVIKNMEGEIQLLAASFELGSDGKYYLSKEAGVNITSEMASLYATKTQYNTLANKVASNTSQINTTANSLSAFTEKISFDSSGNVTNISKSGLVTTSNHATLFASEVNSQGIATQSYVRAQVSDGISNITIGADQIEFLGKTIINGNFIVDTSGNLTINGTINAESGLIAGFKISGTALTNEGFNNDASLIFRNDEYGLFAGIGGSVVPSSTGLKGVARFENHDSSNYYTNSANYTMLVSAQGAQSNVAINMNGGSISGLAIKTLNIGLDYVIQSTAPTYKSVDLDRYVGSVYVSTQYYWKSSSSASSYETKTRNIYLTLPTMQPYDDGHVIKIKRGTNDGSTVYIRAGYTYRNDPNNSYQLTYGSSYINYNEDESATYSSPLAIDGQGDSMTLVYHRDVQRTINGTTYYGCWIQYKHPRDW